MIRDLFNRLRERDVFTVVDAEGALLRKSLEGKPSLVKPNLTEASQLVGLAQDRPNFAKEAARRIQKMGARNVLLSMGGDGAALLTESGDFYRLAAPKGRVRGTTGAGDSLLAGFLAGARPGQGLVRRVPSGRCCRQRTAFAGRLAGREEIMQTEATMKMR